MSDRSILITGCSSGIGRHAALVLHHRGYQVIATARRASDVDALRGHGLTALNLDLDDPDAVQQGVEQTLELTGGRLDALFNNAGFGQYGAVEDLSRNTLRAQFETNLFGPHQLTAAVLPTMRRQGHGRIVQNSSVLGLVALPYRGAYNASKFALEALTDTLRLELHGSGIFVALIEPGPISSRFGINAEAALLRAVDAVGRPGPHAAVYAQLPARLRGEQDSSAGRFRLGPQAVVDKLLHALESRRPKTRYYVTTPTYAMALAKRMLPAGVLDRLVKGQV